MLRMQSFRAVISRINPTADWESRTQEVVMDAAENQIDAYPGVANGECCLCVNVASGQFQFPKKEAA